MKSSPTQLAPLELAGATGLEPHAPLLRRITRKSSFHPDSPLRCVSSGYLADGHSCAVTVPQAVVRAAWRNECERAGSSHDGFFHFAWDEHVWLAFGRADGSVRGVYCPEHAAARDARRFVAETPASRAGARAA